MKLVEFSRGYVRMPEYVEGTPLFVCPAYVVAVAPHLDDPRLSWVSSVGGNLELVVGTAGDVAERLAGAGVDRLPRMAGRPPADPDRPWIA